MIQQTQNQYPLNFQRHQTSFLWNKIDSQLKTKHLFHYFKFALKPNSTFIFKNQNQLSSYSRLHIDMQKPLKYQHQVGWNWHKSANLPIISIKLQVQVFLYEDKKSKKRYTFNPFIQTLRKSFLLFFLFFLLIFSYIQAKIYAVKIVYNSLQKNEFPYLQDVGIKGQNIVQLQQGCGYFNGLRFDSTSYIHQGMKMHLLIVIFNNKNQNQIPLNIFCSVLSSSIFVDSRKSARNFQQNKYMAFVNLFQPGQLKKEFIKKQSTQQHLYKIKQIKNDFEGLYHYLTAANIRHKIKHPIFLAIKFSHSFKIFVNIVKCEGFVNKELFGHLKRFHIKLYQQIKNEFEEECFTNLQNKEFIIGINSQCLIETSSQIKNFKEKYEKIIEMLQILNLNSFYITSQSFINKKVFKDISEIGDLQTGYFQVYQLLKGNYIFKNAQQQKQDVNKINYEEDEEKIETMRKKVKTNNQTNQMIKLNNNPPTFFCNNPTAKVQNNDMTLINYRRPLQKKQSNYYQTNKEVFQNQKRYQNYQHSLYNQTTKIIVRQKIKCMCVQLIQKTKSSIIFGLLSLKRSNSAVKIQDVEHFVFSYSNALLDEIDYREHMLKNMIYENDILRQSVLMMRKVAYHDLQNLKKQIKGSLLKKPIILKLNQQNMLTTDHNTNFKNQLKFAQISYIQNNQKNQILKKNKFIIENNMLQQKENSQILDSQIQLSSSCKFDSNVLNFDQHQISG